MHDAVDLPRSRVLARKPLPRLLRRWFWSKKRQLWREFPGRLGHDLRWLMASSGRRRRWVGALDDLHPAWLFLVGLNNSGTTLLSGLLARFPTIAAIPAEGQKLSFGLPRPGEFGVSRVWGNTLDLFRLTEDDDCGPGERLKYDWSFHLPERSSLALVKCTQFSVRTPWLQACFPSARFIGIVRHPFAVCEGIRRRTGHPLSVAARHWRIANERMLADFQRLDRRLLVRYEDLCERPQQALESMAGFLSLPVPDLEGVLDVPVEAPTVTGLAARVANFNSESDARLSDDDRALVRAESADLMRRLGYSPSSAVADGDLSW